MTALKATPDVERDTRIRQALKAGGFAALLAWHPEEVVLTTGGYPYMGMTLCLYPAQGEPVVYAPVFEPPDTQPDFFKRRPYTLLAGAGLETWNELRTNLAADLAALPAGPVGLVPTGSRHAPPGYSAEWPVMTQAVVDYVLGGQNTLDASALLTGLMQFKTAREVEQLKRANRIAAVGLQTFYSSLQPGLTEAQVAAAVEAAVQGQCGRDDCQLARGWAFVQGGENARLAGTYSRSSGNVLREGDLVVLELATCVDGYWSDLTRAGFVGEGSAHLQTMMRAVQQAQQAAIDVIRAGAISGEVDKAARDVLTGQGYGDGFTHFTGHQVGFRYHDPGLLIEQGSPARLETGMVVTVEPGVYGAAFGGGLRFEENVYVGENGPVVLSPQAIRA